MNTSIGSEEVTYWSHDDFLKSAWGADKDFSKMSQFDWGDGLCAEMRKNYVLFELKLC